MTKKIFMYVNDVQVREYVTESVICEVGRRDFPQPFTNELFEHSLIGEIGQKLIKALMEHKMIEEIVLRPKSLTITKGSNATWSDLEPKVLKALEDVLGSLETVRAGYLMETAAI